MNAATATTSVIDFKIIFHITYIICPIN